MQSQETELNYQGIIFFIGFMGCGKTRLGKKLANKTSRPFVDLDQLIEETQAKTISQIFEQIGEVGFRELEMQTLQNTPFAPNTIVSTGGGAPCFYNNVEWMNAQGITFFIDTPIPILASRLIQAKTPRPLIVDKSYEQLLQFIESKLLERRPFYKQAKLTLNQADVSPEMVIELINNLSCINKI